MTYNPEMNAALCYELAVSEMRKAYLAGRRWLVRHGRWESAEEWLARRATVQDARAVMDAMQERL